MPNTYTKVCAMCGKTFTAHQSRTQCCSDACSKKLYKFNKKKILAERTQQDILEKKREELLSKTFLSISDSAKLLGTIRKMMKKCFFMEGSESKLHYESLGKLSSFRSFRNPNAHFVEQINWQCHHKQRECVGSGGDNGGKHANCHNGMTTILFEK